MLASACWPVSWHEIHVRVCCGLPKFIREPKVVADKKSDSDSINITTEGSKVVLSGKVRSFVEKKDAEKAAYLAPGVTHVENKLVIDTEVYSY